MFRKFSSGASWQNPALATALRALDPLDLAVRTQKGLGELPPYSTRVRSNGLASQFGGSRFQQLGELLADHLTAHARLCPESRVLDIGCGCGRLALPLLTRLQHGNYTGVDVDFASITYCRQQKAFSRHGYRFVHLDVRNGLYNMSGCRLAEDATLPVGDGSFDIVCLVSVFTHMFDHESAHYISEVGRILRSGGRCMISTFLMDYGLDGRSWSFHPTDSANYFVDDDRPEIAIGYESAFLLESFIEHGMSPCFAPLLGNWRSGSSLANAFGQDILFFERRGHMPTPSP